MAPFSAFMDLPKSGNPLRGQLLPRNPISDTQLRIQWENPSDILSLLLLLAPDVIQRSIAQLNGPRPTPVAFSFGWVAYSVSALLSTIGGSIIAQSKKGIFANVFVSRPSIDA